MESRLRKDIIHRWAAGLPLNEQTVKLFEKVRDIPYGNIGSRDPQDVYDKNKGTCSGKHELLKELYKELGVEVKNFVAVHKFNDLKSDFPKDIKEILDKTEIRDPHNFLKIKVNGKWLTVDATWDKPLKKLGFPVTENWDGKSDTKLCVVSRNTFETDNPIEVKEKVLAQMPEKARKDRELFLKRLTGWLERLRK